MAALLVLFTVFMVPLMEASTCLRDWDWVMSVKEDKLNKAMDAAFKEKGEIHIWHQSQSYPGMTISMSVSGCTIAALPGEK